MSASPIVPHAKPFELLERKTTNTAAYAAVAAIVCSLEAFESSDTSNEKTTIQIDTVTK